MKISSLTFYSLLLLSVSISIGSCKKSVQDLCAVSGQSTGSITDNTATINWHGSTPPYGLQYRKTGAPTWVSTFSADDSLVLRNLAARTNYEWQVKSACGSGFSGSTTFTTTGPLTCDPGYEGANCSTESRTKYLGIYTGSESCYIGTDHYSLTVAASPTGIQKLNLSNIYNQGFDVQATLSDSTFTIPSQQVGSAGSVLSGYGSFSRNGSINSMTVNYSITPTSGTGNTCTFTGSR